MDKNNTIFQEFRGYWQLSEEMIAKASRDDIAENARILPMLLNVDVTGATRIYPAALISRESDFD